LCYIRAWQNILYLELKNTIFAKKFIIGYHFKKYLLKFSIFANFFGLKLRGRWADTCHFRIGSAI